jgi:UDP-N-acetylmuramoyl-tripeptide--D-alanyl-D-alanine ligase
MPSFSSSVLEKWTGGRWAIRPAADTLGFSVDSRRLSPGHGFVALKTERRDGHDYLAEALKAGASMAIVSHLVLEVALPQLIVADPLAALQSIAREHRKAFKGTVVGVTGSAGKTSTKELLALALGSEAGDVLSTEGNLNNHIGVALTLTRLDPTTHRFAVIEAGISAPGEMAILARMIEPDMAIVTLVAPAHLADLGGLESVAREKALLAHAVRPGGTIIFPADCADYPSFASLPPEHRMMLEKAPAVRGGGVPYSVFHQGDRTTVAVELAGSDAVVTLRRTTDGMARNVAMTICAATTLGATVHEIQRRLVSWRPSQLRGEWKVSEGRRIYLDCYNANPASMADALATFDALAPTAEPRLLVVGCMEELGADSERYHFELGKSLRLRKGDRLVAVGGLAGSIRTGALAAGVHSGQIEISETVGPLVAGLSAFKGSIFVKGSRRHELEKAFGGSELAGAAHA